MRFQVVLERVVRTKVIVEAGNESAALALAGLAVMGGPIPKNTLHLIEDIHDDVEPIECEELENKF